MIAICVDDEPILLDWLGRLVSASPDISTTKKFTNETDARDYAQSHPFDIAFLDIELHAMDGLTLAEHLRVIHPDCGIIFCTGHAHYAVDAISRLRVDGYLIKPIDGDSVQREIDRFKARHRESRLLLTVTLTEGGNILDQYGRPVHFKRRKTEQLLTILVQQKGNSLSVHELCERLWEDSEQSQYLYEKNANYLTQLLTDLRHTLKECGAQDVLKKTADGYAVCMPLIRIFEQE